MTNDGPVDALALPDALPADAVNAAPLPSLEELLQDFDRIFGEHLARELAAYVHPEVASSD